MLSILAWMLLTLLVVSFTAVVASRHGVEYMIGMYAALVVIANVLASKIVVFAGQAVPAAVIAYSSSFLLTDMLSEFYGEREARTAVWTGFLASIALALSVAIAISWESAPFWSDQAAFESVLGNTPRIVLASLAAYLASQHHDVKSYAWWKRRFPRHLWLRNNASTVVSQAIDTVLFISIAFYGLFPVIPMMLGQYAVKLVIALLDTPFIYTVKRLKVFDKKRDSPQ